MIQIEDGKIFKVIIEWKVSQENDDLLVERIDDIFAIIQEDAAMSCNQSPLPWGNDQSE